MSRLSPRLLLTLAAGAAGLAASCVPMARPPAGTGGPGSADAGDCAVVHVVDGDTVDMTCPGAGSFRARLTGFDTPESFEPGCVAEARAARAATDRLRGLVAGATRVEARLGGVDRYGRRLVALRLDDQDVGAVLIAEGLAVAYAGGRRIDWCARLG